MSEGSDLISQQWPWLVTLSGSLVGGLKAWQIWLDIKRLRLVVKQLEREQPNTETTKRAKTSQRRKLIGLRFMSAVSVLCLATTVLLLVIRDAAPTNPRMDRAGDPTAPANPAEGSLLVVDWKQSVLHVVPLQFQVTDGNETELQFQIAVTVAINGIARQPWNPGRQSLRIESWRSYPFTFEGPRSLEVSLAEATGAGTIDVHVYGQWARVREGLPELNTINYAEYVRSLEHKGKTFALPNGERFEAPLSISNFAISEQDLVRLAREAAKDTTMVGECGKQRCVTFVLAQHQYDAFAIPDVREVLVDYEVSATITFQTE